MSIVCDCCGGVAYDEDKADENHEPTHTCQECREDNHLEKFDGCCQGEYEN